MPWDKNNYPASMKNLSGVVRTKAIEIANTLLDEGYEEGRAISIAQAKKWLEDNTGDFKTVYHVVPHEDSWALKREHADKASFVFDTKEETLQKASEMAEEHPLRTIIHGEDGKIQYIH